MSKQLQIGAEIFNYPETGTNPQENWGDEATGWAEAVTDTIATIFSPNDIVLTTYALNDNVSTPTDIAGLKFSVTQVIYVKIDAIIERIVGVNTYVESLTINGNYDGNVFYMSQESTGDAGIAISVTNSGQFQYTSSNLGHTSCTIKFKANTISN